MGQVEWWLRIFPPTNCVVGRFSGRAYGTGKPSSAIPWPPADSSSCQLPSLTNPINSDPPHQPPYCRSSLIWAQSQRLALGCRSCTAIVLHRWDPICRHSNHRCDRRVKMGRSLPTPITVTAGIVTGDLSFVFRSSLATTVTTSIVCHWCCRRRRHTCRCVLNYHVVIAGLSSRHLAGAQAWPSPITRTQELYSISVWPDQFSLDWLGLGHLD